MIKTDQGLLHLRSQPKLIAMNADLLEAAKALPLPERIELAEALWESITGEGHEPPLTPAQADELDRRSKWNWIKSTDAPSEPARSFPANCQVGVG